MSAINRVVASIASPHSCSRGLETIFSELLELDSASREAALQRLYRDHPTLAHDIRSLLRSADQADGFLSRSPIAPISFDQANSGSWIGQSLGAYQIIREIGRGGMGTVFLAERADGEFHKQVAIKLVNRVANTDLTLRRFMAERQILANLEHPNIARLLDGGTTEDGCPYLVMEYIYGDPIDRYCRINRLPTGERLELFIKVCSAVQFAHQNLVIHRDLKPANILITSDGVPKLLDFGIAKLLEPDAVHAQISTPTLVDFPLMTPEYASPEQVSGEAITTATDVYALGVIFYALLTGHQPYTIPSRNIVEIAKIICNNRIRPPSCCVSEGRSKLSRDLDNIALIALRKEPKLRYQSVQNFAADISCYLEGKPVTAVKDSWGYRSCKFIKRNKLGVCLGTLALSLLLAATIVSTWQWRLAQAQQVRAERHYDDIRRLANTLIFEVADEAAKLPRSTKLRRLLLDRGLVYLDNLADYRQGDTKLQHELAQGYFQLAKVQGSPIDVNLGHSKTAYQSLIKSVQIWESLLRYDSSYLPALKGLAQSYKRLSAVDGSLGNYDRASGFTTRCIGLLEEQLPGKLAEIRVDLLGCYNASAHWLTALGDYRQAKQSLKAALTTIGVDRAKQTSRLPFLLRVQLGRIYEELAEIDAKTGNHHGAVINERKRLAALPTLQDDRLRPRRLADAYHGLAARLAESGDIKSAIVAFHRSLSLWSEHGIDYAEDIRPRQGMAGVYADLAKWYAALADRSAGPRQKIKFRQQSCDAFKRSQQILDQLPDHAASFGMRYSWLQSPANLLQSLADYCAENEEKKHLF